jgi:hypothetical protein
MTNAKNLAGQGRNKPLGQGEGSIAANAESGQELNDAVAVLAVRGGIFLYINLPYFGPRLRINSTVGRSRRCVDLKNEVGIVTRSL